ncbi:MAG: hypothetical protein U5K74_00420 [Gemmatimonadaceae bacterium]|nr:hypothetical protein [Gemmatimonadaceae bacterium]
MHDGTLVQATAAQAALLTDVVASSRGDHDGMHALQSHAHPASDQSSEHGEHQCQCLGCCAGASALSLPDAPDINVCSTIAATQAHLACTGDVLRSATRFAFALPFANGPPAATPLSS